MKQFLWATKPFCAGGAEIRKQRLVIEGSTTQRTALPTGDRQMRSLSFILAFAFVLAGPSMAGAIDSGLPGVGSFAYNGAPVSPTAAPMLLANAR